MYNFRIDVINYLIAQQYRITVLAPDDGYSAKLTAAGCAFQPIEFNNKTRNPVSDFLFYRMLRDHYREIRPDFIFHYVAKPNIYGSLAAGAEKIPSVAVVTGLGYPFARKNLLFILMRALYHRALTNASEVWFLNNEDAQVFVREKIVKIAKVKVLPGEGINTTTFSSAQTRQLHQPFAFLMSTRLLKSKGIFLFADAARILKKKHYNVQFNLLGFFEKNHPDSISPENLDEWKREGLIHYHGFADDVRPFLQQCDCFVFPSYYNEGVPRCLMEAASMELPIITSYNRGCKEVVLNNSNGYICNVRDPFDLADKMEKMFLLSPEERERMGKNGRQLVLKKFGMSKILQEYSNTLISAFENNHGSNS